AVALRRRGRRLGLRGLLLRRGRRRRRGLRLLLRRGRCRRRLGLLLRRRRRRCRRTSTSTITAALLRLLDQPAHVLALLPEDRDRRAQLHRVALLDQQLQQDAVVLDVEVHVGLVGLDL